MNEINIYISENLDILDDVFKNIDPDDYLHKLSLLLKYEDFYPYNPPWYQLYYYMDTVNWEESYSKAILLYFNHLKSMPVFRQLVMRESSDKSYFVKALKSYLNPLPIDENVRNFRLELESPTRDITYEYESYIMSNPNIIEDYIKAYNDEDSVRLLLQAIFNSLILELDKYKWLNLYRNAVNSNRSDYHNIINSSVDDYDLSDPVINMLKDEPYVDYGSVDIPMIYALISEYGV